ncbi:MAG: glutamate dehydrogenase [Lentisphaerae bacterium]|nr:glutamate dehydrogenase [Lentisphaerota bacterium]
MDTKLKNFMQQVQTRNPGEPEFHQAVGDVLVSIMPVVESVPAYRSEKILERLVEPERVIMFRVPWVDDAGEVHVNRGFRVEMNSALGPYKGGLRGKSDGEVMRFCQSFMNELHRHIGPNTDVPAGDIGVGAREIGYLFGQYKKLTRNFSGVLTGKGLGWGGSLIRREATGYGLVYFAAEMLAVRGEELAGKTALVSGAGNVAQYTIEKLLHCGARVLTASDSHGFIHDPDGIDEEKLAWLMELKNIRRGRIRAYVDKYPHATYVGGQTPWSVPTQLAFPCATQNEITEEDARRLVKQGCICVGEGANMPATPGAVECFLNAKIMYAPGKAANAGGVATSGLEMSQNAMHMYWPREEVDRRLREIMQAVHAACLEYGQSGETVNYVKGANVAAFRKVANAMLDQGVV